MSKKKEQVLKADYIPALLKKYKDIIKEISFINNNMFRIYEFVASFIDYKDEFPGFLDSYKDILYSLIVIESAFVRIEDISKLSMCAKIPDEYDEKIDNLLND